MMEMLLAVNWQGSLQAGIDFYFTNLFGLTALEYIAIAFLLVKKIMDPFIKKRRR